MADPTIGAAGTVKELIPVDVNALRQVLLALVGPAHLVRELQATRSLHQLGHTSPIDTLCEQLDAWCPGASTARRLSKAERTELLDWASACQSAYHIDSTPGHRFGALTSNLQENRAGLVGYVESLLAVRGGRTPDCSGAERVSEPA